MLNFALAIKKSFTSHILFKFSLHMVVCPQKGSLSPEYDLRQSSNWT